MLKKLKVKLLGQGHLEINHFFNKLAFVHSVFIPKVKMIYFNGYLIIKDQYLLSPILKSTRQYIAINC